MKRLIIIITLLAAATAVKADYNFSSYFTMGENDTLRIEAGSDTVTFPVRAHFDDLVNSWTMTLTYPDGLTPLWLIGGPDMAVSYLNSQGEECIYYAVATASVDMTTISSIITVPGYWPFSGGYFSFGNAMWAAGDYDEMLYLTFVVGQRCTGGLITLDGRLLGNAGPYGGVGNVVFYKEVTVAVNRVSGDINGDGEISIADVTTLIGLLLNGETETGTAADVDGDGKVNIADVTALINILLSRG